MRRFRAVALVGLVLMLVGGAATACRPPPAPAPVSGPQPDAYVDGALHEFFDDLGQYDCARKVSYRESRWDPVAVNRSSGAAGLFQLLGHDDQVQVAGATLGVPANPYDPRVNALVARWMVETDGWGKGWGGC